MTDEQYSERQRAIKELVQNTAISDQKQLVDLIKKKYGIETNQAVVSRDLHKLGIIKKVVNGVLIYEMPPADINSEILKLALIDIDHNESTIVIKTQPGLAAFVGDYVDQCEGLDVLGCLSGENVVFVAPKSIKNIHKTYLQLCEEFHFKKNKDT